MTVVFLDIGAGSTKFAKLFHKLNKRVLEATYLCAEPGWKGEWKGGKYTGQILKVNGTYSSFNVPNDSLDIVTLNAYHPLTPPTGIEKELFAKLKAGGLFFSAHPVGWHPELSEKHFTSIGFDFTKSPGSLYHELDAFGKIGRWSSEFALKIRLKGYPELRYPASPVVRSRFDMMCIPESELPCTYVYGGLPHRPSVKIWRRNEMSAQ